MALKPAEALPLRSDTLSGFGTACTKSAATAANVKDSDYHRSLALRNIYIERIDPPSELMRRAREIMADQRAGPQTDDATAQGLVRKARELQSANEDFVTRGLSPIVHEPDERLTMSANQLWSDSVPIRLKPGILTNPLRLPTPKPDRAFGYSQLVFTDNQLATIDLLVDNKFGKSYAMPDKNIRFPFLNIEFKSQANGGTHYIATNQVAGAGAIALYGHLELMRRSSRARKVDMNEPQFFSVTIDHELVRINAHWLSGDPSEDRPYNFHVETVERYLLNEEGRVRAAMRAIHNILDYSLEERLNNICEALDEYREIFIAARDAVVFE